MVVEGSQGCPTLMGRDWLCKIRLNWHELFMVSREPSLDSILESHGEVFKPQPQSCKAEVSLVVKPEFFFQPDQFHYVALRALLDEELDEQVKARVLVPVHTEQWAFICYKIITLFLLISYQYYFTTKLVLLINNSNVKNTRSPEKNLPKKYLIKSETFIRTI